MERYPRSSRWIKARSERCNFWFFIQPPRNFATVCQITTIQRIFNNLGIDSMGTFGINHINVKNCSDEDMGKKVHTLGFNYLPDSPGF